MGIKTLLKNLKSIIKKVNISQYSGEVAAVDALCWLHQSVHTCGKELSLGIPTTKYVNYCMKLVELLINNGITPVLVFDGRDVPIKENTNKNRESDRKEYLKNAASYELEGKTELAYKCYSSSVDITPELYIPLINCLINRGVGYIIAPYEADVQIGYLSRNHLVDFVITEDSDSLVYGCERVLFKMNDEGNGDEIRRCDIFHSSELHLTSFTDDMFMYLCILSGCDYLKNLKNKGMIRLVAYVEKGKSPDRILQSLQLDGCDVTEEYRQEFKKAINSFRYQIVYDPVSRTQCPLLTPPNSFHVENHPYLGVVEKDLSVCEDLASMRIHPETRAAVAGLVVIDGYDHCGFLQKHVNSARVEENNLKSFFASTECLKEKKEKDESNGRSSVVKGIKSKYFRNSENCHK